VIDIDADAAEVVARTYPCTADARARNLCRGWVTIALTLDPMSELAALGYPVERVRVSVSDTGDVYAMPLGDSSRSWEHRNPAPTADPRIRAGRGDLCLQYAQDPESLRWLPSDGLRSLIAIVHRHLIYEEAYRRTMAREKDPRDWQWPVEDAPHGSPSPGTVHPITSPQMRKAVTAWAR
jgi:hypothetical protein